MSRFLAMVVSFAACTGVWAAEGASPAASSDRRCDAVVHLLHDGQFDAADALLGPVLSGEPDPADAFFYAFVAYWRLLYDDENPDLRSEFKRRLDRVVALAESRSSPAPVWAGSARLLRAQLLATEGRPFKAAFEAKRARKLLRDAVVHANGADEPYFALGAYNYYASQVPALVKGLRFLLALPGGNRDRGLRYLERVADGDSCLSMQARLLLATILSDKHERDFSAALAHLDLAARESPVPVAVAHAAARLDLALARPLQATGRLDRALERAQELPGTDPAVLVTLRYHRARAELASMRPDLALKTLRPLHGTDLALPVSLRVSVKRLTDTCARWAGRPAWLSDPVSVPVAGETEPVLRFRAALDRARPGLDLEREGDAAASADWLGSVADDQPGNPALALFAGRASLLTGRGEDALRRLARAARSPGLPDEWRGQCRLLAGQAADLSGDRVAALRYYRKVASGPGFIGKEAAFLYQRERYRGDRPALGGPAVSGSGL